MEFNTTFNNISVISWRSGLLVEKTGVPGENLTGIKLIFFNYVNYYKLHGAIMVVIVW
jgi:hypothetical protein